MGRLDAKYKNLKTCAKNMLHTLEEHAGGSYGDVEDALRDAIGKR